MRRKVVGSVILIKHSGEPTVWPVRQTGSDDLAHLHEIFETAVKMCSTELMEGGCLKLLDADSNVIREQRGPTPTYQEEVK